MAKLTRKTLEGQQPINVRQLRKKEGFLNRKRRNREQSSFLQRVKTHKGQSVERMKRRRMLQQDDDAVPRSRPTQERSRREVREERRSEQNGHALGRAWPRQVWY
ncbi:hypothetical protein NDU88_002360 [Pleurodeles waltl]|uniref:Uncharacterized protein n=1 Tax=Pleurodeles waltl TaxID=8319 RepID=A0AAV7SCI2_PLEWA|nr:hypothetical protein NDU88_002360 [Pleurodeles waltl]